MKTEIISLRFQAKLWESLPPLASVGVNKSLSVTHAVKPRLFETQKLKAVFRQGDCATLGNLV